MKQKPTYARSATAAIAAVLAVLANPALGQNSTPSGATDPATPPIVPPSVTAQPTPVKRPAPAPATAAQPVAAPRIVPVIEDAPEPPTIASAEPTAAPSARPERAEPNAPVATASRDAAVEAPASNERDAAADIEAGPVAPVATAEPVDMGETGEATELALGQEELALAALAGLLGIGAVGGAVIARRRRRKSVADVPAAATAVPEPTAKRDRVIAPVAAARAEPSQSARQAVLRDEARVAPAATASLRARIDYTKPAGYYESMVDQGPNAINPFLTRRKRLARAKFLDRELERAEERKLAETGGEDFATRLRRPALV